MELQKNASKNKAYEKSKEKVRDESKNKLLINAKKRQWEAKVLTCGSLMSPDAPGVLNRPFCAYWVW